MGDPEKLDMLRSRFLVESQLFRQANQALRGALDGEGRAKALGTRILALEQADILLDGYNDILSA